MAITACQHPYLKVNRIRNQTIIWSGLINDYKIYMTTCSLGQGLCADAYDLDVMITIHASQNADSSLYQLSCYIVYIATN